MKLLPERFQDKIMPEPMSGCWLWIGTRWAGYGKLSFAKKVEFAHRFVFKRYKGEIPENFVLDHLCRNPSCVNPDHLEAVTEKVNNNRGLGNQHKNKLFCVRGHAFNEGNFHYIKGKYGLRRICHACVKRRSKILVSERRERRILEKTTIFNTIVIIFILSLASCGYTGNNCSWYKPLYLKNSEALALSHDSMAVWIANNEAWAKYCR